MWHIQLKNVQSNHKGRIKITFLFKYVHMSVSFVLYLFDMTNTTHIIQKTLFHHFYFGKTYSQECVEHYFR